MITVRPSRRTVAPPAADEPSSQPKSRPRPSTAMLSSKSQPPVAPASRLTAANRFRPWGPKAPRIAPPPDMLPLPQGWISPCDLPRDAKSEQSSGEDEVRLTDVAAARPYLSSTDSDDDEPLRDRWPTKWPGKRMLPVVTL